MKTLTNQEMLEMVEYCLDCVEQDGTLKTDPLWVLSRVYDNLSHLRNKEEVCSLES